MRVGAAVLAAGLLVLGAEAAPALPGTAPSFGGSLMEGVRFFAPLVLPKVLQDGFLLREYVCSPEFARVRATGGDHAAVDALWFSALDLTLGNRAEALLISLVVTMDHRRVTFDLPLLGPLLVVPLTSESEEEFRFRLRALPGRLYADTPSGVAGDRDKLQHFFGSAFLAYVFESAEQADAVGRFVELGESRYVPGERLDVRDLRANRQGQRFAAALRAGREAPPSAFFGPVLPGDDAPGE